MYAQKNKCDHFDTIEHFEASIIPTRFIEQGLRQMTKEEVDKIIIYTTLCYCFTLCVLCMIIVILYKFKEHISNTSIHISS